MTIVSTGQYGTNIRPMGDLWTAENKEHLQSLKEMEISLEDTAVGRKMIVLEQQLMLQR